MELFQCLFLQEMSGEHQRRIDKANSLEKDFTAAVQVEAMPNPIIMPAIPYLPEIFLHTMVPTGPKSTKVHSKTSGSSCTGFQPY